MGGSPTNYKQQVPENPALQTQAQKDALAANYARLQQQGMSDQGIVAPEQIMPALKSLGSDIKKGIEKKFAPAPATTPAASGTPNAYNRDTSKSLEAIEKGIETAFESGKSAIDEGNRWLVGHMKSNR